MQALFDLIIWGTASQFGFQEIQKWFQGTLGQGIICGKEKMKLAILDFSTDCNLNKSNNFAPFSVIYVGKSIVQIQEKMV